jgi:hypothetical protein
MKINEIEKKIKKNPKQKKTNQKKNDHNWKTK